MTKVWTILTIRNGEIANKSAVKKLFDQLQDGKYLIEIAKHNKRSNPQNRYYWGLVIPLVKQGIKDMGTDLTNEECHEFLKAKFNSSELVKEETGETEMIPRSTTILTKLAFSEYIENIQQFAAEFLNIVIPSPGEQMTIDV